MPRRTSTGRRRASACTAGGESEVAELAGALFELGRLFVRLSPRDLSLTASSALVFLADAGPCRITALAEREGIAQPSMTELVNRLESMDLVVRQRDPADRRAVLVAATDRGVAVVGARRQERARRFAELVGLLSAEDRATLGSAVGAIRRLVASGDERPGTS